MILQSTLLRSTSLPRLRSTLQCSDKNHAYPLSPIKKNHKSPSPEARISFKLRVILTLLMTGHHRPISTPLPVHQWLRCAQPTVVVVVECVEFAADRVHHTEQLGVRRLQARRPQAIHQIRGGGEQNLGDIDLVRCWPHEREWKGKKERGKKKSGVGDSTLSVSDSNRQ